MAGRNGRVGSEHALLSQHRQILFTGKPPSALGKLSFEQAQHQQSRVALVHVIVLDIGVAELAQHLKPADPKNEFLAKAVILVPSVQRARDSAIPVVVRAHIRIQEVNRDQVPVDAVNRIAPTTNVNGPPGQSERHQRIHGFEMVTWIPFHRVLGLVAGFVQTLIEITPSVKQGHAEHRNAEVGRRTQRIAGQHPKAAAVRWNFRV